MSSNYEEDLYSRLLSFAADKGDATIYSHLRQGRSYAEPITVIMEKIIYALQRDKAQYYEMAVKKIETHGTAALLSDRRDEK